MLRRQRVLLLARLRAGRIEERPLRVLPPAEHRARHLRVKLHRKSRRAALKRLRVIAAAFAGRQQRRIRRRGEAVKMRLRRIQRPRHPRPPGRGRRDAVVAELAAAAGQRRHRAAQRLRDQLAAQADAQQRQRARVASANPGDFIAQKRILMHLIHILRAAKQHAARDIIARLRVQQLAIHRPPQVNAKPARRQVRRHTVIRQIIVMVDENDAVFHERMMNDECRRRCLHRRCRN